MRILGTQKKYKRIFTQGSQRTQSIDNQVFIILDYQYSV